MQCAHEFAEAGSLTLRFDPACRPRDGLRVTTACIRCGALPDLAGLTLHPYDRIALWAARTPEIYGDAVRMGLPTLTNLAGDRLGAAHVITTDAEHRIDSLAKNLQRDYVLGLLKRALPFRQNAWPRAIDCPGLEHPIIIHPGLREKFADRRDAAHVRFAHYSVNVIAGPIEVWEAYAGRPTYRIVGTLKAGDRFHHMVVAAEADNHICDTAYVVDRAERIEGYRTGRLRYAAWTLRP
jgi:hypothetical protein